MQSRKEEKKSTTCEILSYIGTRFEYYEGLTLVNYQLSNNKLFYSKPSNSRTFYTYIFQPSTDKGWTI